MPGQCIISATEVVFSAFLLFFFFSLLPPRFLSFFFSNIFRFPATTRESFCFSECCRKNKAYRIFSASSRGLLG